MKSKIESVKKLTDNTFLNMYHLTFHDQAGNLGDYYFVTRKKEDQIRIGTAHSHPKESVFTQLLRKKTRGLRWCMNIGSRLTTISLHFQAN